MLECAYAHTLKRNGQFVLCEDFCSEFNSLYPDDAIAPDRIDVLFKDYQGVRFIDAFTSRDVKEPSRAFRVNVDRKEYGWVRLNRLRLILLSSVSTYPGFEGVEVNDVLSGSPDICRLLTELRFGSLLDYVLKDPFFLKVKRSAPGKHLLFRAVEKPEAQKAASKLSSLPPVDALPPQKVAEFRKLVSDIYAKAISAGKPALLTYFGEVKSLARDLLGSDKVKPALEHLTSDLFSLVNTAQPGHVAVWRLEKKIKSIRSPRKTGPFDKTGLVWLYSINGRKVMDPLPVVEESKPEESEKPEKPEKPEKAEKREKPEKTPFIFPARMSAHAKFMAFSAFPQKFTEVIKMLAAKAIAEVWSYDESEPMSILRNYIDLTFERLQYEDAKRVERNKTADNPTPKDRTDKIRVSDDGKLAVFNTGLFDSLYDPIYAVFGLNTKTVVPQPWVFRMFTTVNERSGQNLVRQFSRGLPEAASYYTQPTELVYDVRHRIATIHIDHIIDRAKRMPIDFLMQTVAGFDFNREHNDKFFEELIAYINRNSNVKYIIKSRLEEAVKVAENKVRWNFKTAVPVYYPEKKKISMLLPLVLGNNEDRPDVALVLEATQGGYIAHTILTMKQAFNNARLVSRPDYQWLAIDRL